MFRFAREAIGQALSLPHMPAGPQVVLIAAFVDRHLAMIDLEDPTN
jgi:hypothetical protein